MWILIVMKWYLLFQFGRIHADSRLTIEFASFFDETITTPSLTDYCEVLKKAEKCNYGLIFEFNIYQRRTESKQKKVEELAPFVKGYNSKYSKFYMDYSMVGSTLNIGARVKLLEKSIIDPEYSKQIDQTSETQFNISKLLSFDNATMIQLRFLNGNRKVYMVLRHTCAPGYFSKDCNTYCKDTDNDQGHYTCDEKGNIKCRPGWYNESNRCVDENLCKTFDNGTSRTCSNRGKCSMITRHSFECECYHPFEGKFCQNRTKPCTLNPCNNATALECRNLNSTHRRCKCKSGWKGEDCQLETDSCSRLNCENGGRCDVDPDKNLYYCKCTPQYTGENCTIDVNECKSKPPICRNQAICTNSIGGYTCSCPESWGGKNCDKCLEPNNPLSDCSNKFSQTTKKILISVSVLSVFLIMPVCMYFMRRIMKSSSKNSKDDEANMTFPDSED